MRNRSRNAYLEGAGADKKSLGLGSPCHGGDLLFAEACVNLGMSVELLLPMDETAFVSRFVAFAGDDWRKRYYALKSNARVAVRTQPRELGRAPGLPGGVAAWERNTSWLLRSALVRRPDVCELLLWSAKGVSDLSGHMGETVREFEQRTRKEATRIDPLALAPTGS